MNNDTTNNPINIKNPDEICMSANEVDQININHQSNMTLSVNSVITQSYFSIKTNDYKILEDGEADDPK